jgi:hypothetical protein
LEDGKGKVEGGDATGRKNGAFIAPVYAVRSPTLTVVIYAKFVALNGFFGHGPQTRGTKLLEGGILKGSLKPFFDHTTS